MVKTTKSGRAMNPTDAFRKEQRKKELKRNKKERHKVREVGMLKKDPDAIRSQIDKLDQMKTEGALDKTRRHKKRQLEELLHSVVKKRKEYEEKMKEKGEEPIMFSHLTAPKPKTMVPLEEGVHDPARFGQDYPRPEDSVYYHPELNPEGRPPPGKPQMYCPRSAQPEANGSTSAPHASGSGPLPLPIPPPPPPPLPPPGLAYYPPPGMPMPPLAPPPGSFMMPGLPFPVPAPPPQPSEAEVPPGMEEEGSEGEESGSESESSEDSEAEAVHGEAGGKELVAPGMPPPPPPPPGPPPKAAAAEGAAGLPLPPPPPPRPPGTGVPSAPPMRPPLPPMMPSGAVPGMGPPPGPPPMGPPPGAPPGGLPMRPPLGPPPMLRPPPPPPGGPPGSYEAASVAAPKPSYVKEASASLTVRPRLRAPNNPELTSMVPASVRVRRQEIAPKPKPKMQVPLTATPAAAPTTKKPTSLDDSYQAFLDDMKELGALE